MTSMNMNARATAVKPEDSETLVKCHEGLVHSIAKQYLGRGLPWEDLLQEARIGLVMAIRGFDASRGARFSTYATRAIHRHLYRALHYQGPVLSIPDYAPLHARYALTNRAVSLDSLQSTGRPVAEIIGDSSQQIEAEVLERIVTKHLLQRLRPQYRQVLELLYGMDGQGERTCAEVARIIGCSRERIRQIEESALAELRSVITEE